MRNEAECVQAPDQRQETFLNIWRAISWNLAGVLVWFREFYIANWLILLWLNDFSCFDQCKFNSLNTCCRLAAVVHFLVTLLSHFCNCYVDIRVD